MRIFLLQFIHLFYRYVKRYRFAGISTRETCRCRTSTFVCQETSEPSRLVEARRCLEVLQKPSEDTMRRKGAVVNLHDGRPIVYTDSCFFFPHGVANRLRAFYERNAPLGCEIDAYGDFLQVKLNWRQNYF